MNASEANFRDHVVTVSAVVCPSASHFTADLPISLMHDHLYYELLDKGHTSFHKQALLAALGDGVFYVTDDLPSPTLQVVLTKP